MTPTTTPTATPAATPTATAPAGRGAVLRQTVGSLLVDAALPYLVYAALLGGVLTLVILALRRLPLSPMLARWRWLERLHDSRSGIPYGIALAAAAVVLYAQTPVYKAFMA